jgi:trigger factor
MATEIQDIEHQLEPREGCRQLLSVKVAQNRVKAARDKITREYMNLARIPGYRPGKAPAHLVQKKFQKQIDEELERQLVGDVIREIIRGNDLHVLSVGDVEDINFGLDDTFSFKTTLMTAPEFETPDYSDLKVTLLPEEVSDEEIDEALENLRERAAEFEDVEDDDAELEWGQYGVIDFEMAIDGKAPSELAGDEGKYYDSAEDFWFRMDEDDSGFIPGFAEAIEEMKPGEEREVTLTLPEDFHVEELQEKEATFKVTLKGIKKRELPELNDEFAARMGQDMTLERLRDAVKFQLIQQRAQENQSLRTQQITEALVTQVDAEMPTDMVRRETVDVAQEIAQQNQQQGVPEEELEKNKAAIVANAERIATNRVKQRFILARIAQKEGIKVSQEDMERRLMMLSQQFNMTPDKLRKRLEKNDRMDAVHEEVLLNKAMEHLMEQAEVEYSDKAREQAQPEEPVAPEDATTDAGEVAEESDPEKA